MADYTTQSHHFGEGSYYYDIKAEDGTVTGSGRCSQSAGYGDGSLPDKYGAYYATLTPNVTHPHLGGDFAKRNKDGDTVVMSRDNYEKLIKRIEKQKHVMAVVWYGLTMSDVGHCKETEMLREEAFDDVR
jgi:hypothetical protein